MKILRTSSYKRMPWKNGGGETVEIAIFPRDASVDTFDWRISMATVATDGPFSIFPGIDRTLSILAGNGMALGIEENTPVLLTHQTEPLPFRADVPVNATLPDGPITDFNVMTRRAAWRHGVQKHLGTLQSTTTANVTLILALDPINVAVAGAVQRLEELDSMFLDINQPFSVTLDRGKGTFFLIELNRI